MRRPLTRLPGWTHRRRRPAARRPSAGPAEAGASGRRRRAFWRTRVRPAWRDAQLLVLGLLGVGVLALGYAGFRSLEGDQGFSRLDAFYAAVQLFVLESSVPPSPPFALEAARVLAPLVAGYATLRVVSALFVEQAQRLGLRLTARDHVVVAGLGDEGFALAASLHAAGFRVAVIDPDPLNAHVEGCRERGIAVLTGDAADEHVLRAGRVDRARWLVLLAADDANLEIIAAATRLVRGRGGDRLNALVHVTETKLWPRLQAHALGVTSDAGIRVEFFNLAELGARRLVDAYADALREGGATEPHVVFVGSSELAGHAALHLAREWANLRPDARLTITLVGSGASARRKSLLAEQPLLGTRCELLAAEPEEGRPAELVQLAPEQADLAVVHLERAVETAGVAAELGSTRGAATRVVAVVRDARSGVGTALRRAVAGRRPVDVFGLFTSVLGPELLLQGTRELLARAVHEEYVGVERRKGIGPDENPRAVPWEQLPEPYRESNRAFVDGIAAKLDAIGGFLVPATLAADGDSAVAFDADELERLARIEHERWCEDLRRRGWRPGSQHDSGARRHPLLVPWSELDERDREKDRELVRALPGTLARAGFEIHRATAAGASPPR